VSGLLEVTGLALWGFHLWGIMNGGAPAEPPAGPQSLKPGEPIRGSHRVGEILDLYPQLLPVFVAHGFKPLENAFLRKILARFTTVSQACLRLGVDEDRLLRDLNRAAGLHSTWVHSLPLLAPDNEGVPVMKPTEILKSEHRVIEQMLDCLEVIADQACINGALDEQAAGDAIDFFRHFADECHHGKEEAHLFPMLEERGFHPENGPTGVMRTEHNVGRMHLRQMEANVPGAAAGDADALSRFAEEVWAFVKLLREHIQKEDQRLFPMADRALTATDQRALLERFEKVEHHDLGAGTHERYIALADSLAEKFDVPRKATSAGHTCCSGKGH
jgi:hemerythrin-like domain-containing protein